MLKPLMKLKPGNFARHLTLLVQLLAFTSLPFLAAAIETPPDMESHDPRLRYNHPGLVTNAGGGLTAIPLPLDYDRDGDADLLVSSDDVPQNALLFFENDGSPVLKAPLRVEEAKRYLAISHPWPTRPLDAVLCEPGVLYRDFSAGLFGKPEVIDYEPDFYAGRDNQWKLVDWEGDGDLDLLIGISDWREYGWDDAFDGDGTWTQGPLHGFIYLVLNNGSDSAPHYGDAQKLHADGQPIDLYGCPSPNYVDWDGDGDFDLIAGEFLDRISFVENIGTRANPKFAGQVFLALENEVLHLESQMLQVVAFDWDGDGDPDLLVGQEDGTVTLVENIGHGRIAAPVRLKQEARHVKCGALVTPWSFDWDDDGDEDLICGNSAGFVEWIENLSGGPEPSWAAPVRLKADGTPIRIMAGENLSIQGPAEAKWGYTAPCVADWDMDGLPDLVLNTIVGRIIYYRKIGTRSRPELTGPFPIEVAWPDAPPAPAWNWWRPGPKELVVEWRTTPNAIDLNNDGLTDLVLVDHEGFLAFYERFRTIDGMLALKPGERIFKAAAEDNGYGHNHDAQFKGDANNDGIKDVIQETTSGGAIYTYRVLLEDTGQREMITRSTEGNVTTDSELVSLPEELLPLRLSTGWAGQSGRRNFVLTDWDTDGDVDLLVNGKTVSWMENVGQNGEFVFQNRGELVPGKLAGHSTAPAVVDWNKDGAPDLLIGAEDGCLYHFANK